MTPTIWFIIFAVLLVIEIATMGLVTIWFAGGALVTFFVSMWCENTVIQCIVFVIVSVLLLYFTKPVVSKYINGKRIKTNVESIVGKIGRVTEQIDNFNEIGTVSLSGLDWMARSEDTDKVIEVGKKVVVKEVSGVKLIVDEVETENEE